jgi:hypothetical protein
MMGDMKPYAIRRGAMHLSARSWDLIRCAYIEGASATAVSDHFGVSRSAVYKRAAVEGWRRCDLAGDDVPDPAPIPPSAPPDIAPEPVAQTPAALIAVCLRAMAVAVQAGRIRDALDLGRLIALIQRIPTPPSAEEIAARKARTAALATSIFGDEDEDEEADEADEADDEDDDDERG